MTTDQPLLQIVRGQPSDAELAALVAVVAARAATTADLPRPTRSRWATPRPRQVIRPGPGAWMTGP